MARWGTCVDLKAQRLGSMAAAQAKRLMLKSHLHSMVVAGGQGGYAREPLYDERRHRR